MNNHCHHILFITGEKNYGVMLLLISPSSEVIMGAASWPTEQSCDGAGCLLRAQTQC